MCHWNLSSSFLIISWWGLLFGSIKMILSLYEILSKSLLVVKIWFICPCFVEAILFFVIKFIEPPGLSPCSFFWPFSQWRKELRQAISTHEHVCLKQNWTSIHSKCALFLFHLDDKGKPSQDWIPASMNIVGRLLLTFIFTTWICLELYGKREEFYKWLHDMQSILENHCIIRILHADLDISPLPCSANAPQLHLLRVPAQ